MLLRNVFFKTVRDLRWPTFWVGLGLAAMTAYICVLFPEYQKVIDIDKILKEMGPAANLLGADVENANTLIGFLHVEMFGMLLPAGLIAFAITLGSGFTAGEESRGTIDVLLSNPIPRWRVIAEKSAAAVVGVVIVAVAIWVFAVAGAAISSSALPSGSLAAGIAMLALLSLAFGALAVAVSAVTGSRAISIGLSLGLMFAMYLIDALSGLVDAMNALRPLSLFRYYLDGDPLLNGLVWSNVAVLVAVTVVLFAASLVAFERRDLSA
jgi:ABC-2 type transport system permease protein